MRFRFLIVIFLLTVVSLSAQTQTLYTVILPNGSSVKVPALRLGGRDYFALPALAQSVFKRPAVGNQILIGDERISCASGSFFLSRETSQGVQIIQMPYPTIILQKQVHIPVIPFAQALEWFGMYEVLVGDGVISLFPFGRATISALAWREGATNGAEEENDEEIPEVTDNDRLAVTGRPSEFILGVRPVAGAIRTEGKTEIGEQTDGAVSAKERKETARKTAKIGIKPANSPEIKRPKIQPVEPNRYILPPGLLRRELDEEKPKKESTIKSKPQSSHEERDEYGNRPLFASLSPEFFSPQSAAPVVHISAIEAERRGDTLAISLSALDTIRTFQRPEWNGNHLTLRLPSAVNDVKNLRALVGDGIRSFSSEILRSTLLYRVECTDEIKECWYRRDGVQKIIFHVVLKNSTVSPQKEMIPIRPIADTGKSGGREQENQAFTQAVDSATTQTGDVAALELSDRQKKSAEKSSGITAQKARKWALDVIVLDAGHGGHDAGAIGVSGVREKDVTLAIAKKLADLIRKNMPGVKVVMTRNDDTFIELYRRGQIANEQGGKLFLSIHCNSAPSKPHASNGFEAYILRPGRNDDAVRVANRENSVTKLEKNQSQYKELTKEQFIIVNMAQSAFVKFSELFATLLTQEVGKSTKLHNRGTNQAGFLVLVGASMPNVLFETAFLSNTNDEKFLSSKKGQDEMADGLFNAVKKYAEKYEKMLKGGK